MMKLLKIIFIFLLLSAFLISLNAQSAKKHSVPLPDDAPGTPTPAGKARRAHAPAAEPTLEPRAATAEDDWRQGWQDSATISGVKVDYRIVPSLKDVVIKRGPVPVSLSQLSSFDPVEGEQAIMQFRFTDATGTPLTGLNVAAWMDRTVNGKLADETSCHNKIQSFLQMQFAARPEVDLNTYYVLALTKEPSILVIDPRVGFSSSRLYAMIDLKAPGLDWALTGDHDRLFVSMPSINRVAVVDTLTFRVTANLDGGENPNRVVLQPDGKYLWIANDSDKPEASGVTVLDAATLKVAAHIATGKGHHEIVFDESRHAYVTNQDDATVSVISTAKLAKVNNVAVGREPVSLDYSSQSRSVYVASRAEGKISVISADEGNLTATIKANPGINTVRITPDGRWGFAANESDDTVLLFDVSSNRLKQLYKVGHEPYQLAFSASYVYVHARGSENVTLIPLSDVGKSDGTADFVAGQLPPAHASDVLASTSAPSLDLTSAFVANPADRRIYFYTEGMAAPMFSMEGYGKTPNSAMVLDRSIHETSPGIYSIGVKLPKAAVYDVPVFVDSPSVSHCFKASIQVNTLLKKGPEVPVTLHALTDDLQVHPGDPVQVSFKLLDAVTAKPRDGLKDVNITVLLAEGLRQLRFEAEPAGDGVYRFGFTPPKAGVYYIMVHIPSLNVTNQLPYMMLRALPRSVSSNVSLPSAGGPAKNR